MEIRWLIDFLHALSDPFWAHYLGQGELLSKYVQTRYPNVSWLNKKMIYCKVIYFAQPVLETVHQALFTFILYPAF